MTDDQKRRQRVELGIDLEKAQEDAAALRNALKGEADNLAVIVEWLDESVRSINVSQLDEEFYSRRTSSHVGIVKDQRFQSSMNFEHILELRGQFISAQLRVEELASRIRELKATA